MNNNAGSENIYELHYAIQLTPWLVLTPDIQYIYIATLVPVEHKAIPSLAG